MAGDKKTNKTIRIKMNLNKVLIVGRVTADVQLRTTPGGQSVTTLGIATNRTWTDKNNQKQEEVEFHNVVIWGRQAEVASQYVVKGAMLLIEGRLRTRVWTDKTGQQRRTTEILSERMQLGPRPQGATAPARGGTAAKHTTPAENGELPTINLEDEEVKPEDIPF